jgi:hypothetical protein
VEQQHRDRAIESLRARGYNGRGFDELARAAFRDFVYDRYLAAEDETRGHLLNAAGQVTRIHPLTLFRNILPRKEIRVQRAETLVGQPRPHHVRCVCRRPARRLASRARREVPDRGEDWLR